MNVAEVKEVTEGISYFISLFAGHVNSVLIVSLRNLVNILSLCKAFK
jgi:hypothetical protein